MSTRDTIVYSDFDKVDIRVGTVLKVDPFPEARKSAFILWVDFGPEVGERKTSAQITKNYTLGNLIGKKVAAVINFQPKQIGPLMSECLLLGFPDELGEVVLISPDRDVPDGGRLY